jgi:hypothetical protein
MDPWDLKPVSPDTLVAPVEVLEGVNPAGCALMNLNVVPAGLEAAAWDLTNLKEMIEKAQAASSKFTTTILAPALDEVSTQTTELLNGVAIYQKELAQEALLFHEQFVQTLSAGSDAYQAAEYESVNTLVLGGTGAPTFPQAMLTQTLGDRRPAGRPGRAGVHP